MLTREENEMVCRVGPTTPMGGLMRRYWMPACLSTDLPGPDSDPLRVRLLGQNFVAFRDTQGQVGFLNELCYHRGASLALGRVEDCGIRCLYHGWKYGVDGTIQDTPNHPDPAYKERFKAPAYPVEEDGGFIWVYLGPPDMRPPLPRLKFMTVPDEMRTIIRVRVACNWLQLLEGGVDSSHVGILHVGTLGALRGGGGSIFEGRPNFVSADNSPRLEVEDTDFGFHYAAIRQSEGDTRNVRITPFIMPFTRIIPPGLFLLFEVPVDDTNTITYIVFYDVERPMSRDKAIRLLGLDDPRYWQEDSFMGSVQNNFFQDRAAMRRGERWSGMDGLEQEDASIVLSMGPLFDRSIEHVVPADRAVVHLRRVLLDAVRRVQRGEQPRGTSLPNASEIIAPEATIGPADRWQDLTPAHTPISAATTEVRL